MTPGDLNGDGKVTRVELTVLAAIAVTVFFIVEHLVQCG